MDAKKMIVFSCAGLVAWEAGEFAVTGKKPPLPAGQAHIHAPAFSTSASAVFSPIPFAAVTTSTTSASIGPAFAVSSTFGPKRSS